MDGAIIIPLVALLFPILLLIAAIFFDAVLLSWAAYHAWHDRAHWHLGRFLHR